MKYERFDFFYIKPLHLPVHEQLLNWARWVGPHRRPSWGIQPMFRHYRPDGGWETGKAPIPINTLDGQAMEKAVRFLPEKHRQAIRWQYVYSERGMQPRHARYWIGVTDSALIELVHDARSMLKNRRT